MRTYWCSDHAAHDPGCLPQPAGGTANYYSEVAARGRAVLDAIDAAGLGTIVDVADAPDAAEPPSAAFVVHERAMIEFLRTAFDRIATEEGWTTTETSLGDRVVIAETFRRSDDPSAARSTSPWAELGRWCGDTSAPIFAATWAAVVGATRAAAAAAAAIGSGVPLSYAFCRPPGHHAGRSRFGGFCYLNNAAIAAQQLSEAGRRVAVLDVDLHHGNGTQDVFWHRADVLYTSLHIDPDVDYPYYAGYADERGGPSALGANLNLPLPVRCDERRYLDTLGTATDAIDAFGADALVVSLGTDTHQLDPIGRFDLPTESFSRIGGRIAALGLPTVVVQEGGYHLPTLGASVAGFLSAWD